MLEAGVIRHFDVALPFATPESSGWLSPRFPPVVAADARAERTGARPSRAVVANLIRRLNATLTVVRFLAGIKRGKRISLVTMAGAFLHFGADQVRLLGRSN